MPNTAHFIGTSYSVGKWMLLPFLGVLVGIAGWTDVGWHHARDDVEVTYSVVKRYSKDISIETALVLRRTIQDGARSRGGRSAPWDSYHILRVFYEEDAFLPTSARKSSRPRPRGDFCSTFLRR